jgi:hypothetical protein
MAVPPGENFHPYPNTLIFRCVTPYKSLIPALHNLTRAIAVLVAKPSKVLYQPLHGKKSGSLASFRLISKRGLIDGVTTLELDNGITKVGRRINPSALLDHIGI